MDQFSGGEGGGGVPQAAPAYVPPQIYMPPQAPPKRRMSKKLLWIVCGAAVLVLAAVVLVLCLPTAGGSDIRRNPLLFMEDGSVYLAVGAESIELEDASLSESSYDNPYLNAELSADGKTLYYLADVNSSGEGDLMRIALGDAKAEPERIAEDVYTAQIAPDGSKVLYVSNAESGTGDLYLCAPGAKAEKIAEEVSAVGYGFSPNGSLIFYSLRDGGTTTLVTYSGGSVKEVADIDEGLLLYEYMDDAGRMLFETCSNDEYALYLFANGDTERICRSDYNIAFYQVFGRMDEFLYAADDELIYYAQGDEKSLSDEYYWVQFPGYKWYDPRVAADKRFLMVVGDSDPSELYDVTIPGEPVKIGKTDQVFDTMVDDGFRYCAYTYHDTLYLTRKAGSGWSDREEVCENPYRVAFDDSGTTLYYIALDDPADSSGDLCRMSVTSGRAETLMEDVTAFSFYGGQVYALNDDGEVHLVTGEDKSEQVEDDISSLYTADGGLYAFGTNGSVYFIHGKESERVSRNAVAIGFYGFLIASE